MSPTRITLLRSRRRVFFGACLAVLLPIGAHACPVCFLLPTKTPADFLIESEFVVLARESPQQPFTYSPVQVLKGDSAPEEFGLFVDSTTRRRLKTNLNDAVVLVRMGRGKAWRSLGIADAEYQDVVQRILLFADTWTREGGSQERYKFFLSLFGNGNRRISELAYLELGRAPYSTIKKVARAVSPDDLRPILTRREYIEWRSLAILMLAQAPDEQDREFIESSFRDRQRFSLTTNLAAWTTAYVELNRLTAVEEIEEQYLRNANRTEAEVRAVITALSVHGRDGHVELRDRIAKSYGVALQFHPKVAGLIATDLTEWKQWDLRDEVAALLAKSETKFNTSDAKAIRNYLK
jgi:hypothetical protein